MVCYDHVMTLRHSLDKLNQIKGLTHAEQGMLVHMYVCMHVLFCRLTVIITCMHIICYRS